MSAELPETKSMVEWIFFPFITVLKSVFLACCRFLLPRRSKKIACLVSVYQHLASRKLLPEMGVKDLNKVLGIAADDNALLLGAEFYDFVWNSEKIALAMEATGVLNPDGPVCCSMNDNLSQFCSELACTVPPYLRYSTATKMAEDILGMFNKVEAAGPDARYA